MTLDITVIYIALIVAVFFDALLLFTKELTFAFFPGVLFWFLGVFGMINGFSQVVGVNVSGAVVTQALDPTIMAVFTIFMGLGQFLLAFFIYSRTKVRAKGLD